MPAERAFSHQGFTCAASEPAAARPAESASAAPEAAASEAEQTQKLTEANRIIAEDAASNWLYLYPQIVVSAANVTGYPTNGLNAQFFAYDIQKTN